MKKIVYVFGVVILGILFQTRTYAYTKKDLEALHENAVLGDAILSVPYLLGDEPLLIALPLPATFLEALTAKALEKDTDLRSEAIGLIKGLKLFSQFPRLRWAANYTNYFLKIILMRLANHKIKRSYPEYDQRTLRRIMRAIVASFIDYALLPDIREHRAFDERHSLCMDGARFLGILFAHGISESLGELVACNAEDDEDMCVELEDND